MSTGVRRGRVLGRFRRAVDLLIEDEVVALVTPEVGDGPFNVVVPFIPARALPRQFTVRCDATRCDLGPWQVCFRPSPRLWDAHPPWETWRPDAEALDTLRRIIAREAMARASVSPLASLSGSGLPSRVATLNKALRSRDPAAIREAAAGVAGWGPGLTPSGDDYLAGVMLGLWSIAHGHAEELDTEHALVSSFAFCRDLCDGMYQAAAPRTNRISQAFLRAARDGLADAHWHALLRALADGDSLDVTQAAQTVLAFGATSGFDMLLGFLRAHECSCTVV
ncbi:MAG: DUF2877 domain-containing protein [Anaerolineae bacterium]